MTQSLRNERGEGQLSDPVTRLGAALRRRVRGRRWGRAGTVSLLVIGFGYLAVSFGEFSYHQVVGDPDWPLRHDQVGYYAYLPALLTERGLSFEDFTGSRWKRFQETGFGGFPRLDETGRRINVYAPGVAVLQAPLFALGHAVAVVSGAATDGFSAPYRFLASLGGAIYALLGLLCLLSTLRRLFPEWVAGGVVVALGAATNLVYYATTEPLMSHAYSFFALSLVTWATLSWARSGRTVFSLIVGAGLGLIVLIRPTNAVFGLFPLLYLAMHGGSAERWWRDPLRRSVLIRQVALAGAFGLLVTLPLLVYWRWASGSWIYNPYGAGTFYFSEPAIASVLWSYRKGWFVYTPIMLSAIPGLFLLRRHVVRITLPLAAYAAVNLYIVASWWNWWYGGSFGMRALIEMSAPLCLAIAALFASAGSTVRRRRAVGAGIGLFVALNLFQTYQYMRFIHWDGMTEETYWGVFLRPIISEAERREIWEDLDLQLPRRPRLTDSS